MEYDIGMLRRQAFLTLCAPLAAQTRHDVILKGGTVVDGTGQPGRRADVAITGDRIAAVGDLSAATAGRVIDCAGLTVAPGFIDMHNHSDDTIIDEPLCESMVRQGVTTMVLGEGGSAGPVKPGFAEWTTLGGYFDFVEKKPAAANICSYVGQTQVWTYVKGFALEPATPAEIEKMKAEVARAMEEGALGLSTSLLMPPSSLVTTEQLIELAKVAQKYGGIYSTHMRDEGQGVFRSVDEALRIAKGAGIRTDIIHLKIADKALWGQMKEVTSMVAKARAEGSDVRSNVYPYTAGQNDLRAIIPPWAHDGGNEKMIARLKDPALRPRIKKDVLGGLPGWYNHYLAVGSWDAMLLVNLKVERNKPFIGKRMSELIASRGGDPVDVLFDVLIEEGGRVSTVYFHHSEADMQLAMKQSYTSIGSDGSAISPEGPRGKWATHPRSYGTFPRVLGRYVRELKTITMEDAIRKMTFMNADKVSLRERGLLKPGFFADVTVFDATTITDRATFVQPHQYATGVEYLAVNGQLVLDRGRHTGKLPGKVLRGPGYKRA
jgi:N-acyl-D-aspartate/D-glutamate deacylase